MTNQKNIYETLQEYTDVFLNEEQKGRVSGYVCPKCGSGTHGNGTGALHKLPNSNKLYCSVCQWYGDITDLYAKKYNVSTQQAVEALKERYGVEGVSIYPTTPKVAQNASEQRTEPITEDYSWYYEECSENLEEILDNDHYRGISRETLSRHRIGYDKAQKRVILPCSDSFYTARSIEKDETLRYLNHGKTQIFNKQALYDNTSPVVYVTEGIFDALSLEEIGLQAVALNSTSNVKLLLQALDEKPTTKKIIITLDEDGTANEAKQEMSEGLKARKVKYDFNGNYHEPFKDTNEHLRFFPNEFKKEYLNQHEKFMESMLNEYKPHSMQNYLENEFKKQLEEFKKQCQRKTGFKKLDEENNGFASGLYVVGGIPSVGKTTFAYQLADQLVKQGQHVMFFSLEQSKFELSIKSIARTGRQNYPSHTYSNLRIRKGETNEYVEKAIEDYKKTSKNMLVIEGGDGCTVEMIRNRVAEYKSMTQIKPCVFVDYLQLIEPPKRDGRTITDARQAVDMNVTALKRLSREFNIPVVVISSLNRTNYSNEIGFESFKESGGIEYSADTVWGLQLALLSDKDFSKKDESEKRRLISEAKAEPQRKIELVCLKNRNGKSSYRVKFNYEPSFDLYEEAKDQEENTQENLGFLK